MMKNVIKSFIGIIMIVAVFSQNLLLVRAASTNTLRNLRGELSALEAEQKRNNDKKNSTQSEIKNNNNAITKAENEITVSQNKISDAKSLIKATNKKIEEVKDKNKELMNYYQVMQGENLFMQFATDSSNMTELIMRIDAINQIADYQQKKLGEFEALVKENEQLQVDLTKYEAQLEKNIVNYQNKIVGLQNDLDDLNSIGMDLYDEIRSKKELIKAYEQMGCGEDQDLDVCAALQGNVQWLKPLNKGRVNSIYGVRSDPFTGQQKVHKAVDIGGNAEGTAVYSVGNGIVVGTVDGPAKMKRTGQITCGGSQVYIQLTVAGKPYVVQYCHLLQVNVSVGQKVTAQTVIGTQGGGSGTAKWDRCSTGTHLHFGVASGTYNTKGSQSVTSFFDAHVMKPPGYPGKGSWFYSRTQLF